MFEYAIPGLTQGPLMRRCLNIRRARRRAGYTLLELVVNLASSSVLLVGLASTVYITTFAFSDVDETRAQAQIAAVQADMMADLQCAKSFVVATSSNVTFTVPDRTGDGQDDTISYYESSPQGKLMYSFNGQTPSVLVEDITACKFNFLTRTIEAPDYDPPTADPNDWGMRWK